MTYNVFSGTLNPTHFTSLSTPLEMAIASIFSCAGAAASRQRTWPAPFTRRRHLKASTVAFASLPSDATSFFCRVADELTTYSNSRLVKRIQFAYDQTEAE